MGDRVFTGQDVEALRGQLNEYRRSMEAQLLALEAQLAGVEAALETVDTTLAMSALEDEVLVADASGGLGGHADLTYDEVTLYVPGLDVADNAQIDGTLTVDVDVDVGGSLTAGVDADVVGTMTAATVVADLVDLDGTETTELIDVDRVIDGSVTKSAVTVTETRSGTIGSDGHAGFEYHGTINSACAAHAGIKSTIYIPGASAATKPTCFQGVLDSNNSGTPPISAAVFRGYLALDGTNIEEASNNAAFVATAAASRSSNVLGLYAKSSNWSGGRSVGFKAYGVSQGSTSALKGIGAWLIGQSAHGVEAGVFAEPVTKDANGLAVCAKGHSRFYYGNVYVHNATSDPVVTAVVNKSHVTEAEDGSLWVQNQLECDGAGHFDSTLDVDGQADFNDDVVIDGELKGGRVQIDAADNTSSVSASRYLRSNNGMSQNASRGYPQARAGSVVDVAGTCYVNSFSAGAEVHIEIRADGVEIASCNHEIVSTGYKKWSATDARDLAVFTADQNLQFYLNIVGTANIGYPIATAGLQLDT